MQEHSGNDEATDVIMDESCFFDPITCFSDRVRLLQILGAGREQVDPPSPKKRKRGKGTGKRRMRRTAKQLNRLPSSLNAPLSSSSSSSSQPQHLAMNNNP